MSMLLLSSTYTRFLKLQQNSQNSEDRNKLSFFVAILPRILILNTPLSVQGAEKLLSQTARLDQ